MLWREQPLDTEPGFAATARVARARPSISSPPPMGRGASRQSVGGPPSRNATRQRAWTADSGASSAELCELGNHSNAASDVLLLLTHQERLVSDELTPAKHGRSASGVDAMPALCDSGGHGQPTQRTGEARGRQEGERNGKNERRAGCQRPRDRLAATSLSARENPAASLRRPSRPGRQPARERTRPC